MGKLDSINTVQFSRWANFNQRIIHRRTAFTYSNSPSSNKRKGFHLLPPLIILSYSVAFTDSWRINSDWFAGVIQSHRSFFLSKENRKIHALARMRKQTRIFVIKWNLATTSHLRYHPTPTNRLNISRIRSSSLFKQ